MEIDFAEYHLRCELRGHESDVRCICVCGDVGVATSSRDNTVRFWTIDQVNKYRSTFPEILAGHTNFVGPLAWIPPDKDFPKGGLVSGSMDTLILVWDLSTGKIVHSLKGHQMQVTGIVLDNSDIISSSLDCTLRRWSQGKIVEIWEPHKEAIQAVIKLPSGEIVTGSSDTTLRLWRGKTCIHTFFGHTDTVRSLAIMRDLGILSASHDGSIRLWAKSGEVLMELVGHTSIVYSVDSHLSGLVVSGSEDCFTKIWKDGICVQSIEHPGCVWDVKFLENGDIVTACSDGIARIWTSNQDRIADTLEQESYISLLSQYKCERKKVGGLNLQDLPGLETLQIPGTSDGQAIVVREGDNGVAYAWSMRDQNWEKIGEVVDGPEDGIKRPSLDGIQYDYVFDVDIGDGERIRKLPYNRSDNPYSAADKWLLGENLPLSYRQQVVEFILQNSGQSDPDLDSTVHDPYTGSSAYIPGGQSNKPAKPSFKHIPKKGMLVFDVAQFDGILKKISEFNTSLLSDVDKKTISLTDAELSRIDMIVSILKNTSHYHSTSFDGADIDLLLKLLKSWPSAMTFPVIDLLRMMVLHPDGSNMLLKHIERNNFMTELIQKCSVSGALPGNLLTCIRAVANLFKNPSFHGWLQNHRSEILDAFSSCPLSSNKNVQLAYSTLILNYSVLLIEKKDEEGQSQVLSAALEIAEGDSVDVDSRFRVLVSIGSLMLDGVVKKIAVDFEVGNIARSAMASKEAKIAEVGADIQNLI